MDLENVTAEMVDAGIWRAKDLGVRVARYEVEAIFRAMVVAALYSSEELGLLHKVSVVGIGEGGDARG